ncbi:MAG: VOC family protein [Clostridiaceae bacterium]|nr:VOC family protein [Clostridiaceae bacterium]
MKLNKIHHIAIICSDYKKSKNFYTNILNLEVIKETFRQERNSYKLDLSLNKEYVIELFSFNNPPFRPSYPEAAGLRHLAFEVDDINLAFKELISKGVACEDIRIDEITGKKFTFFKDPDDLPLEIYEKWRS